MVINGGAKSFKTWTLIDLAISVATGTEWWGCDTTKGRVLYINFEIQDVFFAERVTEILGEKEVVLDKGQFDYLGLRGHCAGMSEIIQRLMAAADGQSYALIVVDPIYKALGTFDENKAGDIAALMNDIERLAVSSGAAVVFGHHFSKGNQAGKEAIDRAAGSGVFARDPDTLINMTPHKEPDAFTVELILRNFPPMEPFVVRRKHPLMLPDAVLDPKELKDPSKKQQKYSDEELLTPLRETGTLTSAEWQKMLKDEDIPISGNTFFVRARGFVDCGRVKKDGKLYVFVR